MATDPITGLKNDNTTDDLVDHDAANKLVKFVGAGLARLIGGTLIPDGLITRETNPLQIDTATGRFLCPGTGEVAAGFIGGQMFWMDDTLEVESTATGGTKTTLVDTSLNHDDDFWCYAWIAFTSGTNDGEVRQVTGFDLLTHTLAWSSVLPATVGAGDTYVVTFFYIQNLTDDDGNYVYGRALANTPSEFRLQWVANTTGVKQAGDIYLSTLTLASGAVTVHDDTPTDADRVLYPGIGGWDSEVLTGTVVGLTAGGETTLTLDHEYLLLRGGIVVTLSDLEFDYSVDEYWAPDQILLRIINNSGYDGDVDYSVTISGRKKRLFV